MKVKSLQALKKLVESDEEVQKKIGQDPIKFINEIEPPSWSKAQLTLVLIIVALALLGSLAIAGIISLGEPLVLEIPNSEPKVITPEIPDIFKVIASAAIGALAGILVPSPAD